MAGYIPGYEVLFAAPDYATAWVDVMPATPTSWDGKKKGVYVAEPYRGFFVQEMNSDHAVGWIDEADPVASKLTFQPVATSVQEVKRAIDFVLSQPNVAGWTLKEARKKVRSLNAASA